MSLLWEGIDLQPAHRRWRFWVAEGRDELPEVRSSSELIPFRRGRLHQPGTADKRPLEVRGYIKETTDPALRAQLDLLKSLLEPERTVAGTLVDDFEDGSQRWVRAVPRSVIPRYGGEKTRLLSIELEALDPYWYGSWGNLTLDAGYKLDAGWSLDSSGELVLSSIGDTQIITLGTASVTKVRVRFIGPSTGEVGIETVGVGAEPVGFRIARTLGPSDQIEVDNDARIVHLIYTPIDVPQVSVIRNLMTLNAGNQHGEFLRLPAGSVTLRVLGIPFETRIQFTPTYQ